MAERRNLCLVWIFDGLRPDLVQPQIMPHLCSLRERGAWYTRSHCAFPTVTRVNSASLATGAYPSLHGITGNTLPDFGADGVRSGVGTTADHRFLRRLRARADAPLLDVPTTAEVLADHGLRTLVIGTGSSGCAYLLHPEVREASGAIFHHDFCEPAGLSDEVARQLGPAPAGDVYTLDGLGDRLRYASRALLEVLYPLKAPGLVYFWCTVPDALHHRYGLGSPEAIEGLRRADAIFAETLRGLDAATGDSVNLIVTSDHGYTSVNRHVQVEHRLRQAVVGASQAGDSMVVAVDGGAAQVFLGRGNAALRGQLVAWLAEQEWVSAVFTREPTEGALPLESVCASGARSADILICFTWDRTANRFGYAGRSAGGGAIAKGAGDHGGCSPFEMRNTLLLAGPAFKAGERYEPAGIVDIAPTISALLGIPLPERLSGRALTESMPRGEMTGIAVTHGLQKGTFRAEVTAVGSTRYVAGAGRSDSILSL